MRSDSMPTTRPSWSLPRGSRNNSCGRNEVVALLIAPVRERSVSSELPLSRL